MGWYIETWANYNSAFPLIKNILTLWENLPYNLAIKQYVDVTQASPIIKHWVVMLNEYYKSKGIQTPYIKPNNSLANKLHILNDNFGKETLSNPIIWKLFSSS